MKIGAFYKLSITAVKRWEIAGNKRQTRKVSGGVGSSKHLLVAGAALHHDLASRQTVKLQLITCQGRLFQKCYWVGAVK